VWQDRGATTSAPTGAPETPIPDYGTALASAALPVRFACDRRRFTRNDKQPGIVPETWSGLRLLHWGSGYRITAAPHRPR